MRCFGYFSAFVGLLVIAAIVPAQASDVQASEKWLAASGSVAITPDDSIWMAGYAARKEPSQGKVHDLYAKVLGLEDASENRFVIVTLDLIGVTPELRASVEEQVAQFGIQPAALLMNASHTHCGPELRSERLIRFGIDAKYAALTQQYVRDTAQKIATLVGEVVSRMEPATLTYSRARAGFAMNRRLPTPTGFINSPNPDGPVDHDVPVLRVENQAGELKTILFGYACHATTLSFQQLCGDYPGFAQQYLEQSHPTAVAMFLNGCSADQNPYPRRTLDLAKQHGRALANGVETALETQQTKPIRGPLRVAMDQVTLEFAPAPTKAELEEKVKSGNRYARIHANTLLDEIASKGAVQTEYSTFPLQVVQFGRDLTLVAICGEVVVDYSLRFKEELSRDASSTIWVAGYSNYVFGYLPSERVLQEGGYEGGGAMQYTMFPGPFESSVESRVVERIHRLVEQVRQPDDVSKGQ